MDTSTVVTIVVVLVAFIIIGAALAAARRRRRSQALRGAFGSEYDRTVEQTGKRRTAEQELADRQARHDELEIRPLTAATRQRYAASWSAVQARFVDDPVLAFTEADSLLTHLLAERGYPTGDTETEANLLSVEHGRVLENYRAGHAIEQVTTSASSDTEQVRQGMLHFRAVFEDLLGDASVEPYPTTSTGARSQVQQ